MGLSKGTSLLGKICMSANKKNNSAVLYSTEKGNMCPECAKPVSSCECANKRRSSQSDGTVRVKRETKGRKGSGVTTITGLSLNEENLKSLGKRLKKKCGSGGTVKEGVIEIQGDHREVLVNELKKMGYNAKSAGG